MRRPYINDRQRLNMLSPISGGPKGQPPRSELEAQSQETSPEIFSDGGEDRPQFQQDVALTAVWIGGNIQLYIVT